jgi:hypothetical protein
MGSKKVSRFLLALSVWFGITCSLAAAQPEKNRTLSNLSQRVKTLEAQKTDLKELINDKLKIAGDDFENKSNLLDSRQLKFQTEMEDKQAKFTRKIEDDYHFLKILTWIFGPLIVITLIFLYLKLVKRIGQIAEEKIKEKFDSLLEEKESQIIRIIERHDKELQLKRQSKILVVTPSRSDDSLMRRFFKTMEFQEPDFRSPYELRDLEHYHLILFNNEDETFDEGVIPGIVKKTAGPFFFYFGPSTRDSIEIRNEKKVAFANYGAQLYGNLLNALRYQALLK